MMLDIIDIKEKEKKLDRIQITPLFEDSKPVRLRSLLERVAYLAYQEGCKRGEEKNRSETRKKVYEVLKTLGLAHLALVH